MNALLTLESLQAAVASIPETPWHFAVEQANGGFMFVKLPPALQGKSYAFPHGAVLVTTLEMQMRLAGGLAGVPLSELVICECDRSAADRFLAEVMVDVFHSEAPDSLGLPDWGGAR